MVEIPDSHPRKKSLLSRQKMVEGSSKGLLADSAMIAHGRGEAFDYLLGERTTESARGAIRESAARLKDANSPVISVNGNTVLLAGKKALRLAALLGCPIEVNLYYRTPERIAGLLTLLEEQKMVVLGESGPEGFEGKWADSVRAVSLLGSSPDFRIEGLEGPRSHCNPLSRSAKMATVTIVDEVSRAFEGIMHELIANPNLVPTEWDNASALRGSLGEINDFLDGQ